MAAKVRQLYLPTSSAEIRDQMLRDFRLSAIDDGFEDPPVEPGTDTYWEMNAISKTFILGLANISIRLDDTNILYATGAALDNIREQLGQPIVQPSGSSGKVKITVSGTTTIVNGTHLKLPNGLRIKTVGTYVNPPDQQEIDVTAVDAGALTNAAGGTLVTFESAPLNVDAEAEVSDGVPLTGGTDAESDARKRDRLLNVLQNKPAGGNWGHIRKLILDNHPGADGCYVYCAPGGPSSQLVVPTKAFDPSVNDFSRAPSDAAITAIRGTIFSNVSPSVETIVRPPTDEEVDCALTIAIPESSLSGGNGQGWIDPSPWPSLEVADLGAVAITSVTDDDTIVVDAQTAVSPVNGQTHVSWWSATDRKVYTGLIVTATGSAGAWTLNFDRPMLGKDGVSPEVGDYIFPAAQNAEAYGNTWVEIFGTLGPGELTEDGNRLPRAKRHPFASDEKPHSITSTALTKLSTSHPEITNIDFSVISATSPTVPSSVDDPPNILVPGKLAFYPE